MSHNFAKKAVHVLYPDSPCVRMKEGPDEGKYIVFKNRHTSETLSAPMITRQLAWITALNNVSKVAAK